MPVSAAELVISDLVLGLLLVLGNLLHNIFITNYNTQVITTAIHLIRKAIF